MSAIPLTQDIGTIETKVADTKISASPQFRVIDGRSLLLEGGKLPNSIKIGNIDYSIVEMSDAHHGLGFYGNRHTKTLTFLGYDRKNSGHRDMANDILRESQLRYKPLNQWTREDKITYSLLEANEMIGW